jgi:hypothetical protein
MKGENMKQIDQEELLLIRSKLIIESTRKLGDNMSYCITIHPNEDAEIVTGVIPDKSGLMVCLYGRNGGTVDITTEDYVGILNLLKTISKYEEMRLYLSGKEVQ